MAQTAFSFFPACVRSKPVCAPQNEMFDIYGTPGSCDKSNPALSEVLTTAGPLILSKPLMIITFPVRVWLYKRKGFRRENFPRRGLRQSL